MSHGPHLLFFADAESVHTQRWVTAMVERGWHCSVVSRRHHPIPGATVHALSTPDGNWAWFAALPRVRRLAARLRPDIVHGHYVTSYGLWAAACGGAPRVLTGWGSDILVSPVYNRAVRLVTRFSLRRADLITADSQDMLDEIAHYRPKAALHQIFWGADTAKFRPQPRALRPFRIVSLRAWEPNYNIDVILDAVAALRARAPDEALELHLLGGGALESRLRAQAEALQLGSVVRFHGRVDEDRMAELVNQAHVSVSVPSSDATSVALLESMAAGLPVLVSDLPANRQWVDGTGGELLPPRNPQRLADALARLLGDPLLAGRMGEANRRKVEPHASRRHQMDRMDRLYRELLGKAYL
ncbi:glycosyltransferase family 4 protein [Caldimonas brevitalea]|uniref:Glycosyl transferase n=1 Tax=Caldimonas brevitalea TaxID=413882 RepID=A0A0G3BUW1_9BURK|nr:glycosyltransferase family 4 protein [Caldimonas brevitalea]AKJ31181.1 glycosyl transferase [Caldimonas brevitalea]